jgi:hypothetical protein
MMATKDDEGTKYSSILLTKKIVSNLFILLGFYECIGSNTAGEDTKTAQLIYAGIILRKKKNFSF